MSAAAEVSYFSLLHLLGGDMSEEAREMKKTVEMRPSATSWVRDGWKKSQTQN